MSFGFTVSDFKHISWNGQPMYMEEIACIAWGLDNVVFVADCSGMIWEVDAVKLTTTICADIRQEGNCIIIFLAFSCRDRDMLLMSAQSVDCSLPAIT